jgi:hypothetical protein
MITWLQNATGKHHRLIFSFLLVIIVVSFVFYGFAGRGALKGNGSYMYMGVDLNDTSIRRRFADANFFSGQRMAGGEEALKQWVAELKLADTLEVPNPSETEIRKLAREATSGPQTKDAGDALNKFIDLASKQLSATDIETRFRFEAFIKDAWRINKAVGTLGGPGHATTSQVKRTVERVRSLWTVDVARFDSAKFKPVVKVDEEKAKAAFAANVENYRIPAKVAVTTVVLKPTDADTAPVSDEEIITMGYNVAEKFKFDPLKVKEQALAKRAELEKLVRRDRAIHNFSGDIDNALVDKFPLDTTKADNAEFVKWLKSKNATLTTVATFESGSAPVVAGIPAAALRLAGELTDKEWRTAVFPNDEGAVFIFLNKRTPDRLPTFEEVKPKAIENWQATARNRLLSEEINNLSKAIQTEAAAGKSFADSAKAHGLALTSPPAFPIVNLPEALNSPNEDTGLAIATAGVGKVTPGLRTISGDYVFIRAAKSEMPKDNAGIEEGRLFAQRVSQNNANRIGGGLLRDLTPVEKK